MTMNDRVYRREAHNIVEACFSDYEESFHMMMLVPPVRHSSKTVPANKPVSMHTHIYIYMTIYIYIYG